MFARFGSKSRFLDLKIPIGLTFKPPLPSTGHTRDADFHPAWEGLPRHCLEAHGIHVNPHTSAGLKGPRKLLRIRPGYFDFEPLLGPKLGRTKPKISGKVPTNRHITIPDDSGPTSACFDDDPKL